MSEGKGKKEQPPSVQNLEGTAEAPGRAGARGRRRGTWDLTLSAGSCPGAGQGTWSTRPLTAEGVAIPRSLRPCARYEGEGPVEQGAGELRETIPPGRTHGY